MHNFQGHAEIQVKIQDQRIIMVYLCQIIYVLVYFIQVIE